MDSVDTDLATARTGSRWKDSEIRILTYAFQSGRSIDELSKRHLRTRNSIRAHLIHLGWLTSHDRDRDEYWRAAESAYLEQEQRTLDAYAYANAEVDTLLHCKKGVQIETTRFDNPDDSTAWNDVDTDASEARGEWIDRFGR